MGIQNNTDNLYKEGTILYAKADPALKLVIVKYYQRIYYCGIVDHPEKNNLAYFERELVLPDGQDQQVQFTAIAIPTSTKVIATD